MTPPPALLGTPAHLEAVRAAVVELCRGAQDAGLDADVPTCPGWTVRQLVAHQGRVFRWSTAHLRGRAMDEVEKARLEKAGRGSPDPVGWLRDGAVELVTALVATPEDAEGFTFFGDSPRLRPFWARRQAHEATIHAVDALAAAGRLPASSEVWFASDLALDGLDELLVGLVPRVSRMRVDAPLRIAVHPREADRSWTVEVGAGATAACRHEGHVDGDLVVTGDAVALYLALWHRGGPVPEVEADPSFDDLWRGVVVP